jgi:hypothetical protein
MRIFGWITVVSYLLAVVSAVPPPHVSAAFGLFTGVAFLSAILWFAAYRGYRQAMQPPPLQGPGRGRATTEEIYLETAQLRQEAQQVASQAALHNVPSTPDEVDGLMILGVAIDPERYERESPLLKRVVTRDRLFWILTGRKF